MKNHTYLQLFQSYCSVKKKKKLFIFLFLLKCCYKINHIKDRTLQVAFLNSENYHHSYWINQSCEEDKEDQLFKSVFIKLSGPQYRRYFNTQFRKQISTSNILIHPNLQNNGSSSFFARTFSKWYSQLL